MPEGYSGPLEKIDDFRWRIPKTYLPGMRVPGIIYTSEQMLKDIIRDKAPEQVANVAFLPGIVKYSLAMPDIHWGYGFCVHPATKVLSNFGFYYPIKKLEKNWSTQILKTMDFTLQVPTGTSIQRFVKIKPQSEVFTVITKTGNEIIATVDHPFYTQNGMVPLKKLTKEDKVAVFPFEGVPFQPPSKKIIVSEKDIENTFLELKIKPTRISYKQIIRDLKKYDLLPLTYDHPKLPYILKIVGFAFGDASINLYGKGNYGVLDCSGKREDLEAIIDDIKKIGYAPTRIYIEKRRLVYKGSQRDYICYRFRVNETSLVVLLKSLGLPLGSKVSQPYRIPRWIFKAPLWQKRLFLASLFGCELRIPHRRLGRRGYFNAPAFPMAKREELLKNGEDFLKDIAELLKEFGVRTLYIDKRKKHINTKGKISWLLELIISPKPENLFNLWSKIGFEYNFKRSFVANVAVQYLRLKLKILREKEEVIKITVPRLLRNRLSYQKIASQLAGNPLTKRFIIDICWKLNKGKEITPRVPASFPSFEVYLKGVTEKLGYSGAVWDEIEKIEKIYYQDFVYDFTVSHSDHNFIANNFVVSNCIGGVAATDPDAGGVISPGGVGYDINCGVRLMKTNLRFEDIKDKIKDLVYALFNAIPAGVGSTGDIRVSKEEEMVILIKGTQWAVQKGYGISDDIEYTEERGAISGATTDTVSERAYERGKKQAGTLGSGNHFLEIQVIDQIFDKEAADVFGLEEGQVTVMIHSGSRGFGYQICDDYAKGMVRLMPKYNINVPDRQLACVPFNSQDGQAYFGAMKCAANYAWANRQCLMHLTRLAFEKFFGKGWQKMNMNLIYDVAHNIAKVERHIVDGKEKTLVIHRKGATRAFGPGHPDLPAKYKRIGQPVIIPGDMGRNSYLLVGTQKAMEDTFASTCHGAGRCLSRTASARCTDVNVLLKELSERGVFVKASGRETLVEESPHAYKDVNEVVSIVHGAGISKRVCRMRPVGVVKG